MFEDEIQKNFELFLDLMNVSEKQRAMWNHEYSLEDKYQLLEKAGSESFSMKLFQDMNEPRYYIETFKNNKYVDLSVLKKLKAHFESPSKDWVTGFVEQKGMEYIASYLESMYTQLTLAEDYLHKYGKRILQMKKGTNVDEDKDGEKEEEDEEEPHDQKRFDWEYDMVMERQDSVVMCKKQVDMLVSLLLKSSEADNLCADTLCRNYYSLRSIIFSLPYLSNDTQAKLFDMFSCFCILHKTTYEYILHSLTHFSQSKGPAMKKLMKKLKRADDLEWSAKFLMFVNTVVAKGETIEDRVEARDLFYPHGFEEVRVEAELSTSDELSKSLQHFSANTLT
tara:strand:+ start:1211 stop:2221 length:1011 start_codon:yes stop_codon:yes gene_type:complete